MQPDHIAAYVFAHGQPPCGSGEVEEVVCGAVSSTNVEASHSGSWPEFRQGDSTRAQGAKAALKVFEGKRDEEVGTIETDGGGGAKGAEAA